MIKIAIVDDEEQTREQILRTLKENIQEQHEVEIKLYASGESFFEEIQKGEAADILFTDIQMQQLDGVELGKLVRRICPDMYIVFITSYEEYAAESYRIEAYQYILKKDIEERLSPLIERVVHEIKKDYEEYRWVGTNQRKIKIYHKDIVCIQKIKGSKYAEYITENGKYMERLSMNQILEQIHSNAFILVDRGHAVNVNHIVRVRGNVIQMDNGEEITVSRVQSSQVKEKITAYWRALR